MPALESETRVRDLCVWILSCILFGVIIIGCGLLIHGVFLNGGARSATIGLILIAIPWVFWFLTYLYRGIRRLLILVLNNNGGGGKNVRRGGGSMNSNGGGGNAAPSKRGSSRVNDSPGDSPGDAAGRKVQFGDVIVVDDDNSGHEKGHEDVQKTSASSAGSYDDSASTPSSRESERPFASSSPSC